MCAALATGRTPLHHAVRERRLVIVKMLMATEYAPELAHAMDIYGTSQSQCESSVFSRL